MKINKIISTILASILIFLPIISTFANEDLNTLKEEVVYVSTSPTGEIKGVHVVNGFELEKKQKIKDYGKYDNVKNLTSLEKINKDKDRITVEAESGKFFYQGDNPSKELPWNILIEYYLNGEKKSEKEIIGKKGNIKIVGKISKNSKADPVYSEYYLGQLAINLDSDKVIVKEAKNATIAYQGSVQILNYTILPEKELEFEILTESKDFEMQPFNFSAIPFNMNFDLPDTSELTNNLKILEEGISKLNSGTTDLTLGIKEVNKNTHILYNHLKELNSGLNQSASGQLLLTEGSLKFQKGLYQYSQGIRELVNKIEEMGNGLGSLKTGLVQLRDGSSQLSDGLLEYSKGVDQYVDGVTKVSEGHKELTNGIKKMSEKSQPLKEGGSKLVNGSQQIYDGLEILDKLDLEELTNIEDLENLEKIINVTLEFWDKSEKYVDQIDLDKLLDALVKINKKNAEALVELEKLIKATDIDNILKKLNITDVENEDVKKLLKEIKEIQNKILLVRNKIEEIAKNIEESADTKEKLEKLKYQIIGKNEEIRRKLESLKKALKEYDKDKVYTILKGLSGFRSNYKEFHDGLVSYTQGTNQLINSISRELLSGSEEIDDGLSKLSLNGSVLESGIGEIINGSEKFTEALNLIISQLNFNKLDQVNRLENGIEQLVSNYALIHDGQKSLNYGLNRLSNGMNSYVSGFSQFDKGVDKLKNGAVQLNEGTSRLESETSGMSEEAKKQIDEAMKAFKKENFKLKSFVDEKNQNIKLVQFVYVSDALVKEKEVQEVPMKKEMTFWEKVWNIISFWD